MRVMKPLWGWEGNPSGRINFDWNHLRGSIDVKEWAWWTIMIKGEVCVASKKLGQTRPPNVSSNLDIVELGKN